MIEPSISIQRNPRSQFVGEATADVCVTRLERPADVLDLPCGAELTIRYVILHDLSHGHAKDVAAKIGSPSAGVTAARRVVRPLVFSPRTYWPKTVKLLLNS